MKRSLALIATLASGFVLSAAAQTLPAPAAAAPAGPAKIAVIAFQVAVAQTNEGQRNFADLQKKYEPKRQQLKALSDEIDTLTKQLQAQGDKLSAAEQQPTAPRPSTTKRSSWSAPPRMPRTTSRRRCRRLYNGLASKVYDVLANYAQQQGYTLVLDVAGSSSRIPWCSTPASPPTSPSRSSTPTT